MSVLTFIPCLPPAKLPDMAKQKAEGERYFVRLDKETKRRLDFLAVDAGAASTEAFGGKLLAEAVNRLWASFDPKRAKPRASR